MDFLKAPTDNLYKFLALTGLAMVIASLVFPASSWLETCLKGYQLEQEIALANVELEVWEGQQLLLARDLENHQQAIKDFQDAAKRAQAEGKLSEEKREKMQKWAEDIDARKAQGMEEAKKSLEQGKIADQKKAVVNAKQGELNFLWWVGLFQFLGAGMLLGAGVVCCRYGFWQWYDKVQRFQDAILAKQAEEA